MLSYDFWMLKGTIAAEQSVCSAAKRKEATHIRTLIPLRLTQWTWVATIQQESGGTPLRPACVHLFLISIFSPVSIENLSSSVEPQPGAGRRAGAQAGPALGPGARPRPGLSPPSLHDSLCNSHSKFLDLFVMFLKCLKISVMKTWLDHWLKHWLVSVNNLVLDHIDWRWCDNQWLPDQHKRSQIWA